MFDIELRSLAKSCLKLSLSGEAKILADRELERKTECLPTFNTINMVMNPEMIQGQAYSQIVINTFANSLTSMPVYFLSIANSQAIVEGRMFMEGEEEKRNWYFISINLPVGWRWEGLWGKKFFGFLFFICYFWAN